MSDLLLESRDGNVARLILNRPKARNALSLALLNALTDAILRLGQDREIHVIVIAANGPGFCAGHDLKELTAARAKDDRGRAFFQETMSSKMVRACCRLGFSRTQVLASTLASPNVLEMFQKVLQCRKESLVVISTTAVWR